MTKQRAGRQRNRGWLPAMDKWFSPFQTVQIGCEDHTGSYSMGMAAMFVGIKTDRSLPHSERFVILWIPPLPPHAFMACTGTNSPLTLLIMDYFYCIDIIFQDIIAFIIPNYVNRKFSDKNI